MTISAAQQPDTASLVEQYSGVRAYTAAICAPLAPEDYIPQPIVDVSPAKWHIAHVTWFFEEMLLKPYLAGYQPFNKDFGYLFNSYYESVGERVLRRKRGDLARPAVAEVYKYREYVDRHMLELIAQPLTDESRNLIVLGLNHEQQHQELLLTDLKYTFSVNPTCPVYDTDNVICQQPENLNVEFIPMPGGIYRIGHSGAGFCFDNEQAAHEVNLEDFSISAALVTNGQFLEFIADGGYQKFSLWHSEGWDWVKQNSVDSPLYWRKVDDEWRQFTLAGQQTLNPDAPVSHISFYEAFAYAEWKGCRLPTEFEWEAASDKFNWGRRWEWTHSAYLPYPRYRKAAGAVGEYNGKFMINQMVLRGASDATPPEHSRKTYRNFFHPHLRWQFTGLRLAK